jgi:YVTN family beta-propeller protein
LHVQILAGVFSHLSDPCHPADICGLYADGMKKIFLLTCIAALGASAAWAGTETSYHPGRTLKIGGEGGWDFLAVDSANRHLFVSHATQVEVIDLDSGKRVGTIPGTDGVHGIAIASKAGKGFITCGKLNAVLVFDLKSFAVWARVPTGQGPDAVMYDAATNRVFAMNGKDQSATVIDATANAVVATLPLGGKPESAIAADNHVAFVNLEDKDAVVRFDTQELKVTAVWPVSPCKSPASIARHRETNRLFIGCHNDMMAVVDMTNGKVVGQAPIGHGVDAAAFDKGKGLIFQASGDGKLTVVHEDTPDSYSVVQTVNTPQRAKTVAIDGKTGNLYLPVADLGEAPAATQDNPKPKQPVLKDTFRVLEIVP